MNIKKLSRRDFLKIQGVAVGGLALVGSGVYRAAASETCSSKTPCIKKNAADQQNTLFDKLETCCINEPLAVGEMRITFLGTSCTPMLTQQGVSVYVEVGPTKPVEDNYGYIFNVPADYAMFDCGMGVLANYNAAGISYGRMDKIFIAHLHADHMSELSAIYCFGETGERKSPLYVWGPSKSGLVDPVSGEIHEDGTMAAMKHFRELWRWHTESFSFANNGYAEYYEKLATLKQEWGVPEDAPFVPVKGDNEGVPVLYSDSPNDAYALVPIELDWTKYGEVEGDNIAYNNQKTGLKITHFPVIHCRQGSIGYKLEWTPHDLEGNPIPGAKTLSMIYSGDTKPNWTMVDQASNGGQGLDVLVHEIVMPPDAWSAKFAHVDKEAVQGSQALAYFSDVQNSSHTTQGAFGYLLSQIDPLPRLTIATHFQATDDTIESARQTLDKYCIPRDAYTFALDFMVFNVTEDKIRQRRLDVSRHGFPWGLAVSGELDRPKYYKQAEDEYGNPLFYPNGDPIWVGDPEAQLLLDEQIEDGANTYATDGYGPGENYYPEFCG